MLTSYFSISIDDLRAKAPNLSLNGEDCLTLFAIRVVWLVQKDILDQRTDHGDISELCHMLYRSLLFLSTFTMLPSHRGDESSLAVQAGVARQARVQWLPVLDALRAGRQHLGGAIEEYDELFDQWGYLGSKMGLNEGRERTRTRNYCAYWPCPYSRQPPPNALSACRGCGVARYCGKDCQRGNWKLHKKACGNRLT